MSIPGQSWDPCLPIPCRLDIGYIWAHLCKEEGPSLSGLQDGSLSRSWPGVCFRLGLGVPLVLQATHQRLRCSLGAAPLPCNPCPNPECSPWPPVPMGWTQATLRKPPTGLEPCPCPGRNRVGVSGGTRGAAGRTGTGRSRHAPCWAGAELPAAAAPGVKRSCPGMVQPPSWEMD